MVKFVLFPCSHLLFALLLFGITMQIPVHDVWFWLYIGSDVLSVIVSGMPEPTAESSLMYVWVFRSLHGLSRKGTAYFIHRNHWQTISGEKGTEYAAQKRGVC